MAQDPRPLRVVVFGSGGPLSIAVLDAVASAGELCAAVLPPRPRRFSRAHHPFIRAARSRGANVIRVGDRNLADKLRDMRPDLFCIATFPTILDTNLLSLPRLGALNVHPSLLPRHRGPDPLFWSYFANDATTGVTIHWATERADCGPIVAQASVPIPRGEPVATLYARMSDAAATLVRNVLHRLEAGRIAGSEQDERLATTERRATRDAWQIDYDTWPVERLWHFLAGLSARRDDLLSVPHGRAKTFSIATHARTPGTIEVTRAGIRVWARDGYVDLDPPSWRSRLRRAAARVLR